MIFATVLTLLLDPSLDGVTGKPLTVKELCERMSEQDEVKRSVESPLGNQVVLLTGDGLTITSVETALATSLEATWTREGSVHKLGRTKKQQTLLASQSEAIFDTAFKASRPKNKLPGDAIIAAREIKASYTAYVQRIHNQLELPTNNGYTRPRFSSHFEELTESLLQLSMPKGGASSDAFLGRSVFSSGSEGAGVRLLGTEPALRRYDALRLSLRNLLGNDGDAGVFSREHLGQSVFGNLDMAFSADSCTLIRTGKLDDYQLQTLVSTRVDVPIAYYFDSRPLMFDGPKENETLADGMAAKGEVEWSGETKKFYGRDLGIGLGTKSNKFDFLGHLTRDVLVSYGSKLPGPMIAVLPDTAEVVLAKGFYDGERGLAVALASLQQGRLGLRKSTVDDWTIIRPQDLHCMELSRIPREVLDRFLTTCMTAGNCGIEDLAWFRCKTTDIQASIGLQRYAFDLLRHKGKQVAPVLSTSDDELICGELLSSGQFRHGARWGPEAGSSRFKTACKVFAMTSAVDSDGSRIRDVQAGIAAGNLHWTNCRFRLEIEETTNFKILMGDTSSPQREAMPGEAVLALLRKENLDPEAVLVQPGTRKRIKIVAQFDDEVTVSDEFWDAFVYNSRRPFAASKLSQGGDGQLRR